MARELNNVVSDRTTLDDSSSPADERTTMDDLQTELGTKIQELWETMLQLFNSLGSREASCPGSGSRPADYLDPPLPPMPPMHPAQTPPGSLHYNSNNNVPSSIRHTSSMIENSFKELCLLRFGPPARSNPLGDLVNLKQTGSIEEYQKQFQERLAHASLFVHPSQHVHLFTAGLVEALRLEVELQGPSSLDLAMNLACTFDAKQRILKESLVHRSPWLGTVPTSAPANPNTPLCPGQPTTQSTEPPRSAPPPQFIKRLSKFDMEKRWAQGLCFNYDEKYTQSHICRRLFWLEVDDPEDSSPLEEDVGTEEEAPTISVNAFTGLHSSTTMQVHASIQTLLLLALVDLGSTHNFLSQPAAQQLGLSLQYNSGISVSVANGEKSTSVGSAAVTFVIEGHTFRADFLIIPLAGFDLQPAALPPIRACDHRIRLKLCIEPVVVRPYRYPHLQKDEIERQCELMLTQGIIQTSRSPFSSPVLLVKKQDNSWQFCVDYRELNAHTVKEKFPIPVVDELLDELHGAELFTKLDLKSGYHQVRVHPDDVEKTAFRTHHGHFEFLVMPFGLSNAPSTFQTLMNEVFRPFLRKYVLVFFDDILIYSQNQGDHIQALAPGTSEVAYLGHVISASGVKVNNTKIQSVLDWPTPHSVTTLRGFLGLAGYYRKFIRDYGQIAALLTSLLKRNAFTWTDAADSSFQQLKQSLASAPVLQLPNFEEVFIVECDASGGGIGAVLQQQGHPIAYFSRQLASHHHKLAAYERELIGLVKAI
ncbi:uncharacterized protein [Aristolochia californica]|uniref:uncharacterized protein n=1 Tax=Aristolochia californica TaxID=171875 RepID=UPI0035D730FE